MEPEKNVSFDPFAFYQIDRPRPTERPGKGRSLLMLPDDFTVIDTETTGLSWAEFLEMTLYFNPETEDL